MARPMLICGIVLVCMFISVEAQVHVLLECRICRNALNLEDCKESLLCARNEECYTDEIITPSLQIMYNAGCRAATACKTTDPQHGKRQASTGLIACSHCCNVSKTSNTTECNANICGLKTKSVHSNQCYHCSDDDDARQGDVLDVHRCRKIKFCGDDEVCRVTTKNTAGVESYEFGCYPLLQCQLLTIVSIETALQFSTGVDLAHLQEFGEIQMNPKKRQLSLCDICCGDGLCNDDKCAIVRDRIGVFAKAGRFNYTSLRLIK